MPALPSLHSHLLHVSYADSACSGPIPLTAPLDAGSSSSHASEPELAHVAGDCLVDEAASMGQYVFDSHVFGSGAFGTVRRAIDLKTGQLVAIKQCANETKLAASAIREAIALSRLRHAPNVIGFRAYAHGGEGSDTHSIVMDAATGGDLFERVLSCQQPIAEVEARGLFAQMLRGVMSMHANGVAHRDLKLENVVMDGALLRWIDFGLSHVFERKARHSHFCADEFDIVPLTEPVGSTPYMPPEVAAHLDGRSAPGYDAYKADVWALGVCLFAMLHGFFPHTKAEAPEAAFLTLQLAQQAGVSGVCAVLAHYGRPCELSPELVHLLDSLLQTDPAKRPSAHQLAHHAWLRPCAPVPAATRRPLTPSPVCSRPTPGTPIKTSVLRPSVVRAKRSMPDSNNPLDSGFSLDQPSLFPFTSLKRMKQTHDDCEPPLAFSFADVCYMLDSCSRPVMHGSPFEF